MTDVFVIGGGPAGLAAAIAARLRGFQVTVADAGHPPIDKACGEGLMPGAIPILRALGISPPADSFPFRGVRFAGDGVVPDADFSGSPGVGIRRTILHSLLTARASELGVALRWDAPVSDFSRIRARWIVGADGQNSRVRAWSGLANIRRESIRYGFRKHFRIAPWSRYVEVHWGARCQVYVTPVGVNEAGVALLTRDPHVRLDAALAEFPDVAARLNGAPAASNERGGVTASRSLRRVYRDNVVLIGDASGSVDAITGEGLSLSFHQAVALADALEAEDLEKYQKAHRRLIRRPAAMARLLLMLDRSPRLRRRTLRALASHPRLFSALLALHTGTDRARPDQAFAEVVQSAGTWPSGSNSPFSR